MQPHFEVVLRDDGVIWLRRRNVPYDSIADVDRAYDQFLNTVDDWLLDRRIKMGLVGTRSRAPMGWLYDLRDGPSQRNDPAFEEAIRKRRQDLLSRSPVLAILVKTAAGRMQLDRMGRQARAELTIFDDFDKAVAFVLQQIPRVFAKESMH